MWPKLGSKPDTNYNEDGFEWTVNCLIDEKQEAELKKGGYEKIQEDKEGKTYVAPKKPTTFPSGDPRAPINVVDKYGDPVDPDIIGNESVCNVRVALRNWEYKKKSGVSLDLIEVQVVTLNEYLPSDGKVPTAFNFEEKEEVVLTEDDDEDLPF